MIGIVGMLLFMGLALGLTISIVCMEFGRRLWPFTYVIFEERQGNLVCNVVKGKFKKDKSGAKNLVLKPKLSVMGLGALFQKAVMSKTPDNKMSIVMKGGGQLILAYSPKDNTFMPITILKDANKINMIVEDDDVRNWYKVTWEKYARLKMLNPKRNWEKYAPALILGAGVILIIMIIVGNMVVSQNTTIVAGQLSSIQRAVEGLTGTVASVGGTTIPY